MGEEKMKKVKMGLSLDCPPGGTRPEHLLEGVLEGTGIAKEDLGEPVAKCFGNWSWDFYVPEDKYIEIKDLIHSKCVDLYNRGITRYSEIGRYK